MNVTHSFFPCRTFDTYGRTFHSFRCSCGYEGVYSRGTPERAHEDFLHHVRVSHPTTFQTNGNGHTWTKKHATCWCGWEGFWRTYPADPALQDIRDQVDADIRQEAKDHVESVLAAYKPIEQIVKELRTLIEELS